jgi:hypothetical protein
MNKVQILNKIKRNLDQRGISAVRGVDDVVAAGATITCVDAEIQSPMGGSNGSVSPFLGMGIANPGKIQVEVVDVTAMDLSGDIIAVLREVFGFANDVVLTDGVVSVDVRAMADLVGMGQ